MNIDPQNTEHWEGCKSGLLVNCSKQAKSALRKKTATKIGTSLLTLAVFGGLGVWSIEYWRGPGEYYFGGIACHEVQENIPAMMAGALPDDVRQRMEIHLSECPQCRALMAKIETQQAAHADDQRAVASGWSKSRFADAVRIELNEKLVMIGELATPAH